MQTPPGKKMSRGNSRASADRTQKASVTSPEDYLDARLARERSAAYRDPFPDLESMAQYMSAFSNFVRKGGMDHDLLGQLFVDRITVRISKDSQGGIEVDRESGITTIILPNIPRQSPKARAERIEKMSMKLTQSIQIARFNFFCELIRGMPEEARQKLLAEHHGNHKKNPHR